MDAYFKKYTDVINRTGRKEKTYLKELVQTVDDFLDKPAFKHTQAEEPGDFKDLEPSGAESALVQLKLMNVDKELPIVSDNPLTKLEEDKPMMMNDFKKTLNSEVNSMRGLIENHVRTQLGLNKPTRETGAQTFTYARLKDEMEHELRFVIEK